MHCTYRIVATPQPRVLARLLQHFDQQSLLIQSLVLTSDDAETRIRISVEAEPALAHRLHAKLLHLLAVEDIQLEII